MQATTNREAWNAIISKLPATYAAESAITCSAQNADHSIGVDTCDGIVAVDAKGEGNEAWYSVAVATLRDYLDVPEYWDGHRKSEGGYCDDADVDALLAMHF